MSTKLIQELRHVINNPHSIITGSTPLIRRELEKTSPDIIKIFKHLDDIDKSVDRITEKLLEMQKEASNEEG